MTKRIEEISKETKTVLQSSTTEKEDERGKERVTVAAGACFNTQSIQEEAKKPILFFPEKGIWSHFWGGLIKSYSRKFRLTYHKNYNLRLRIHSLKHNPKYAIVFYFSTKFTQSTWIKIYSFPRNMNILLNFTCRSTVNPKSLRSTIDLSSSTIKYP